MDDINKLLILKNLPRIGNAKINNTLLDLLSSKYDNLNFEAAIKSLGFTEQELYTASDAANQILIFFDKNPEYSVLCIKDENYPAKLNIMGSRRPVVVYVYGNISLLTSNTIGVIGTRKPSGHVQKYAPRMLKHMIESTAATVVSGLANGCDTIGHEVAIDMGAPTIAVLPSGYKAISTKKRQNLAQRIVEEGGLLISEYPPEMKESPYTMVQRDCIIAALSDKVISLQCSEKSGTMHTIEAAYNFEKPIGCYMPKCIGDFEGHIYAKASLGAQLIESFDDIDKFINKPEMNKQLCLFDE